MKRFTEMSTMFRRTKSSLGSSEKMQSDSEIEAQQRENVLALVMNEFVSSLPWKVLVD